MTMKIYIANLGAYNRGYLVGKWVELPLYEEELQEEIQEVLNGPDAIKTRDFEDQEDEEWAIHDYECSYMKISECSSPYKLNEIAEQIEDLDQWEEKTLKAILETGNYEFEDVIDRIDEFQLYEGIDNERELGDYYIEEVDCSQVPDYLMNYIDTESYGRDISINEGGDFTSYGYLREDR